MENNDVQALQYTPRHSTSLHLHRLALSLLSLPLRARYLVSHFDNLPLAMSETFVTTNQSGNSSENAPSGTGHGPEPRSSAGGGKPATNTEQGDNPAQV